MPEFKSSKEVILKGVTLYWNDLFQPGDAKEGMKSKYKAIGIFEKDSDAYKIALAGMREAAQLMWGNNGNDMLKNMAANNKAVRNGNSRRDDAGAVRPEYENMFFISAGNKVKPQVVGPVRVGEGNNKKFVHITESGGAQVDGMDVKPPYKITVPYRGCKVNLKVQFIAGKAFQNEKKETVPNQVYAKLIAVQFAGDGTPFGPGATSAEGFDDEDMPVSSSGDDDDDIMGGSGSSKPQRSSSGFDDMDDDIPF